MQHQDSDPSQSEAEWAREAIDIYNLFGIQREVRSRIAPPGKL